MLHVSDQKLYQQHRNRSGRLFEIALTAIVFASMGAITWAIRGTNGWGGMDGTIVPGMMWGILWWFVCWRKGIDARGIPFWLCMGLAIGGDLGYGQYVSWIQGNFYSGDEIIPISPWLGFAWFAVCGIGWGAPGGIALGWALDRNRTPSAWIARLVVPFGFGILTRIAIQTWPGLFFPHWERGVYVPEVTSVINADSAAAQNSTIITWLVCVAVSLLVWIATKNFARPSAGGRTISIIATSIVVVLLLRIALWLFFPSDGLGLFSGALDRHASRTVYTNSQNAIVVGWWLGAILLAIVQRDQFTLVAGLIIGAGFGIGFPLSAVWCLGYSHAPELVDWWKMWELHSGVNMGLLYVAALYWSIHRIDDNCIPAAPKATSPGPSQPFVAWCETLALAGGGCLLIYIAARDYFPEVGLCLGMMYLIAMMLVMTHAGDVANRRRSISFVYSVFLLVFMLAWGGSSQSGILLGLYDGDAVDQYAWPMPRIAIFTPVALFIVAAALVAFSRALHNPRIGIPRHTDSNRINNLLLDLIMFTGIVGAASIWPAKIGVLYACFLAVAVFAFSRLNSCFMKRDAQLPGKTE